MDTPTKEQSGNPPSKARPLGRLTARGRAYAALIFAGCVGLLALAVWMKPDPKGFGTHRQLGFGKCGMLVSTGLPCPTCGMTTAFSYMVRGRLGKAFMAQPAGLVIALGVVAVAAASGWSVVRGRIPNVYFPGFTPYRLFFALLVLLLGAWAFKIAVGLANGTLPDPG